MTEHETIDELIALSSYYQGEITEYVAMAIEAIEELERYKKAEEQCIKECGWDLCDIARKYQEFLEHMHELAEYWKLGTIEQVREAVEAVQAMKERNITSEIIMEYAKFEDECVKQGFTFKSLLEARERNKPKKPIKKQYECYACPSCNSHEINDYCSKCGTKLDWSVEE